jgi:predicted membrane protein
MLADNLGFLRFRVWDFWPLLLIYWGAVLLIRNLRGELPFQRRRIVVSDVDQVAIFGGSRRVITGEMFDGGRITAVFGGVEADLRHAGMTGQMATIEADVLFGGAEIKVPQTWDVSLRGVGIFGGFGDDTLHPSPGTPGVKRLIVRGSAIFGGVSVKN